MTPDNGCGVRNEFSAGKKMSAMDEIKILVRTAGPKMIPFMKAVSVYFLLDAYSHSGEYWTSLVKCAPIIGLMLFIVLYDGNWMKKFTYTHKIWFGLLFSCIGDALLNHNYFPHGMGSFAIAQLFYISAFGFRPLKLWIGLLLYAGGVATVLALHENLEPTILIGLPIYTILLVTMCWRAVAQLYLPKNNSKVLRVMCAVASLLFVISDTMIAIDKYHTPINNSTLWIMITYYAAQFGITLSIVDLHGMNDAVPTNCLAKLKKQS